jgi:hypothetical protein
LCFEILAAGALTLLKINFMLFLFCKINFDRE